MRFREIFRFEFLYQLRSPLTLLLFVVLIIVGFVMTRDGMLAEALHDEFFINSSFAVAKTTIAGCLLWLLVAPAIAGQAAARNVSTRMYPLTYTTPVTRAEYLGGRLLAAFVINALMMLAVQVSIMLAIYLPGVDAALIGPFRPAVYITAYAFLSLPNAFVATIIQFALASHSGKPMAGFLGSVVLFVMSYIVATFFLFQGQQDIANTLDLIGVHFILSDLSHLWTTAEKNFRILGLEGTVLANRVLWLGVALVVLCLSYISFHFSHRTEGNIITKLLRRNREQSSRIGVEANTPIAIPHIARTFGIAMHARQTMAIAWSSFRKILTSWAGLFLVVIIPLMIIPVIIDQMSDLGVPLIPITIQVIMELSAPLSAELSRWVVIPLLIAFFAGELVWREREVGLGEITDTLPGSEWAPLLGKFLGIAFLLALFTALQIAGGIVAQSIMDYNTFEIGLYVKIMFGLQLPEYLLFAFVALVIHVVVNHKYIGHLVAIMSSVLIALAPVFGIEHNLLIYSASPGWTYTEMRGFGPTIGPWLWFKLYWAAWALFIAVIARLLWVRGRESSFRVRLQLARRRFSWTTMLTSLIAIVLIATLGGFIFYNTNVLNDYDTASDIDRRHAEYEQLYGRYAQAEQPQLTKASLKVEIYPRHREVEINGTYQLVNKSTEAIDTIHVAIAPGINTGEIVFGKTTSLVIADKAHSHRIYRLEKSLAPGDSLQVEFTVYVKPNGFKENGVDASVVANGSFFMIQNWLPAIGYQRSREVSTPSARRKYGLAPRPFIPSLYDTNAVNERDAGIVFDAVIGTDEDQTAVAPGALRRTWTEQSQNAVKDGGLRRYFHYSTDTPIGNEWTFCSARYTMREEVWKDTTGTGRDVMIRVFHDPRHATQVDRIIRSTRASLDYYTKEFGPYEYGGHLTIAERPGSGTGMHADAAMLTYSEGFALWTPKDETGRLDLPYAVVAHEMGHQWNSPYAVVEGAPIMSESLAWYYGMKLFEHARGPEHLQALRAFMREPHPYAPIRRGEPLLRGLDPYLSYRKGPFALYALSEYIGEDKVNTALRRLRDNHLPENTPLVTTLDLYRELQAVTPDSARYLLHDLFEVNTFWNFRAEKVTATKLENGEWQVTLAVHSKKVIADSGGVETEMPINEWVQIGVFGAAKPGDELGNPLYIRLHRIKAGQQTITVNVKGDPRLAGIDPYHLIDVIESEDDDNIETVMKKK